MEAAVEAVQQIVGGAAAPGHIAVRELRDGLPHLGGGAQAGQRLGGGRETDDGGLTNSGSVRPYRAASFHSGLHGAGRASARSARGLTVRRRPPRPPGRRTAPLSPASGTIHPSSPGCASIMRSSRCPRGRSLHGPASSGGSRDPPGRVVSRTSCTPGRSGPPVPAGAVRRPDARRRRVQDVPGPAARGSPPSGGHSRPSGSMAAHRDCRVERQPRVPATGHGRCAERGHQDRASWCASHRQRQCPGAGLLVGPRPAHLDGGGGARPWPAPPGPARSRYGSMAS